MLDRGWNRWIVGFGSMLAVTVGLALAAGGASAQGMVKPTWPDCQKGNFPSAATKAFGPLEKATGIQQEDALPDVWVECKTPVYLYKQVQNGTIQGRPAYKDVVDGTRCPARRCAVFARILVYSVPPDIAKGTPIERNVSGDFYLEKHSSTEGTCGKARHACRSEEFLGTLSQGEGDYAVCGGIGGEFPLLGKSEGGDLIVLCTAWMVAIGDSCPTKARLTSVIGPSEMCKGFPKAPDVPPSQRPSKPGEPPPVPPGLDSTPGGTPTPHCGTDSLGSPPSPGCDRVTVQVVPSPLPSDPSNEAIGDGVGSATIEPGGQTLHCLNPQDAPACVIHADVAAGTSVTVTEQPGSLAGDPLSPPDSAFEKFAGACSGAGACTFTPASGGSIVQVYFIPAMVTLTLQATGDEGHANMTANGHGGAAIVGLEPVAPVFCGASFPANPLPCHVLARLDSFAQVEADAGGDEDVGLAGFSSNCTTSTQGPDFCDILMTSNQTVVATFGAD